MAANFFLAAGYSLGDSLSLSDIVNIFVKQQGYTVGDVDKDGHRPITLKLLIQGETTEALNQHQQDLKWKLEQAEMAYGPNGVGMPVILHARLGDSESWTYWTVVGGKVTFAENEGQPDLQMDATVELTCLPHATSDPVTVPVSPATDSMHPVFVDAVRGDCAALGSLIVTDVGTVPIGGLLIARRGHRSLQRSGFKPFYPATGTKTLTTNWQDIASFDSPRGAFDSGIFDIVASITDGSRPLPPISDLAGTLQNTGGLQGGFYEYEITSLDAFGQESAPSNLFAITVPGGAPFIEDANPDPASITWSGPLFLGGTCTAPGSFSIDRPGLCRSTSNGLYIRVQSDGWVLGDLIRDPVVNQTIPTWGNVGATNKLPPKPGELGYAYTALAKAFPAPQTHQLTFQYDILLDSFSGPGPVFFPQLAPFGLMYSTFGWAFYCSSAGSSEDIATLVDDWKSGRLIYTLLETGAPLVSSFLAVKSTVRIDIDWRDGPVVGTLFVNGRKVATLEAPRSNQPANDVSLGIVVANPIPEWFPLKKESPDEAAWSYTKVERSSHSENSSTSSSNDDSSSSNDSTNHSDSTTDSLSNSINSDSNSSGSGSNSSSTSDTPDNHSHTESHNTGHNHTDATATSTGPDGTNTSSGGGDSDDHSDTHGDTDGRSHSESSEHSGGSGGGGGGGSSQSHNHDESHDHSTSTGKSTSNSTGTSSSSSTSDTKNAAADFDVPKTGLKLVHSVYPAGQFKTTTDSTSDSSSTSTSDSSNTSNSNNKSENHSTSHSFSASSSSSGSSSSGGSSSSSSNSSTSTSQTDSGSSGTSAQAGQTADGATLSSNDNSNSSHGSNSSSSSSSSTSGGENRSSSSSSSGSGSSSDSHSDGTSTSNGLSTSTSTSTSKSQQKSTDHSESIQDVYKVVPMLDTAYPNPSSFRSLVQASAYFSNVLVLDGDPSAGGAVLLTWTPDTNSQNQRVWRVRNTGAQGAQNHWQFKTLGATDASFLDSDPNGWTDGTPTDTTNGPQSALFRVGYSATATDELRFTAPQRAALSNGRPEYLKVTSKVLPPGPRPEPESDDPGPFHIVIQAKTDALTLPQSPEATVNGVWLLPQSESQFLATAKKGLAIPLQIKLDHRRDKANSARAFSVADGSLQATWDAKGELTLSPGGNWIDILAQDVNGVADPNIRFTVQVVYTPKTEFLFGLG